MAVTKNITFDLARKLHDAGLIPGDLNDVRRIVFVLDTNQVPVLYVEYFADERWLDVVGAASDGIKVVTAAPTASDAAHTGDWDPDSPK